MKQILSEKYGLIQGKEVEFINHPSIIFADDKIKVNTFDTEKEMFDYVFKNIDVKTALSVEPQERVFYKSADKIVVKVDGTIKEVNEKAIDNIITK